MRALLDHLGLDRADLLAHSAGASIALQIVVRHPERVSKLALVTPSGRAVGLIPDDEVRAQVVSLRKDEPWFSRAFAAYSRLEADTGTDEDWDEVVPFFYGRWDAAAQAHAAAGEAEMNEEAANAFDAEGAFDTAAARAGIASFGSPVLVLAGRVDLRWPEVAVAELASMFPASQYVVLPGAGHFPWLDDAGLFVSTVTAFLDGR